jgi:hypothetical protein
VATVIKSASNFLHAKLSISRGKKIIKTAPALLQALSMRKDVLDRKALVKIMIVVAIIALLGAIAVPGFLGARKRSRVSRILNDLRMIDSAVDQYAKTNRKTGDTVGK